MSNKAKYVTEERTAASCTTDLDNGRVKVEMFIPGLEPGRDKFNPKGGKIQFDFMNGGYGFDMITTLKDKIKNTQTVYKLKVNQLPGRIIIGESTWIVEKGKIVVLMEKHADSRNINWREVVFRRGLDQESSSSSDDD